MKRALGSIQWKLDLDLDRNPTLARIRALPPGKRAAVVGGALLLAWLALEQWSWSWARDWSERGDRIEQALAESRALASGDDPAARAGAELFGPVEPPAGETEGAAAMTQAVVDVVKRHTTTNFSFDAQRASSRLPGNVTLAGASERLSRVSGELRFEATPSEAAKIIQELEASQAIEAISALRLEKIDNETRLKVRLTVEAWVFGSRGPGRRA